MSEFSYRGSDRRQYPRIPFWYIVKYREYIPPKGFSPGKSKNISIGGILLETNTFYPVSTILEIELDVPLNEGKHIYAKVLGKVVRSSVIDPDKTYDIAIQFTSIPTEYNEQIQHLIKAFEK